MQEHVFLKINIQVLKIVGIKQVNIKNKNLKLLETLHRIYSTLMQTYFTLFVISEIYEVFRTLGEDFFVTVSNLGVSLLYLIELVKIQVCKSKRITYLMNEIIKKESKIVEESDNKTVELIYWEYIRLNRTVIKSFTILGIFTAIPFFLQAVLLELQNPPEKLYEVINGTVTYHPRPLPFVSYFPFDQYKYYNVSYVLHCIAGASGAAYIVATDILFYSMFIFVKSQIKILQHKFEEFKKYSVLLQENVKCSLEEAIDVFIGECVEEHTDIIKYIKYLNDTMKGLMLLDFGLASMQMAMLGFQIISVGFSIQQLFAVEYLCAMLVQMFLFYWLANEITLESVKISSAIYNSDWFDCTPKIKKSFHFIMIRSSKPLTLNAGPFYAMSTTTALSILRAAYSYVALMRQTYIRNRVE